MMKASEFLPTDSMKGLISLAPRAQLSPRLQVDDITTASVYACSLYMVLGEGGGDEVALTHLNSVSCIN